MQSIIINCCYVNYEKKKITEKNSGKWNETHVTVLRICVTVFLESNEVYFYIVFGRLKQNNRSTMVLSCMRLVNRNQVLRYHLSSPIIAIGISPIFSSHFFWFFHCFDLPNIKQNDCVFHRFDRNWPAQLTT